MQEKRLKIIEIVSTALSIYNDSVTEQSAKVWLASLERFNIEDIQRAFNLYVQTAENGHFSPKPADIIRLVSGTNVDRAKTAWSMVERAVKSIGHYRTVIFPDPIIHRVIYDLGGWVKVCSVQDDKELHFLGLDFEKRYAGYMNRGKLPVYPSRLVGAEESSKESYGYKWTDSLSLAGSEEACLVVFKGGVKPSDFEALAHQGEVSAMIENSIKRLGVE